MVSTGLGGACVMKGVGAAIAVAVLAAGHVARAADLDPRQIEPVPVVAPVPVAAPAPIAYQRFSLYGGFIGGSVSTFSSHKFVDDTVDTEDFNVRGKLFGGVVGFSYRNGPWVLAVENDLQSVQAEGTANIAAGTFGTKLRWLYNYRARIGYS